MCLFVQYSTRCDDDALVLIIGSTILLKRGRSVEYERNDLVLKNYHWNKCCYVSIARGVSCWNTKHTAMTQDTYSFYNCQLLICTCSSLCCFHVHMLPLNCRMNLVHIGQSMYASICVTLWRMNCLSRLQWYDFRQLGTWLQLQLKPDKINF